mmetsp:Transcript_35974/g.81905  ORF Transcript_35974/g.81905 Transcript_35974/m.81905 type:complete len:208 (-) Transcript_35974:518-1141(-)
MHGGALARVPQTQRSLLSPSQHNMALPPGPNADTGDPALAHQDAAGGGRRPNVPHQHKAEFVHSLWRLVCECGAIADCNHSGALGPAHVNSLATLGDVRARCEAKTEGRRNKLERCGDALCRRRSGPGIFLTQSLDHLACTTKESHEVAMIRRLCVLPSDSALMTRPYCSVFGKLHPEISRLQRRHEGLSVPIVLIAGELCKGARTM